MEENNQSIIPQEDLDFLDSVLEEQHKEIPENSKTLLLNETTSRFSGAIWHDKIKEKIISLAGLGGIGSWLALLLARMQVSHIRLYDFDFVEEVNMAGQLYCMSDIRRRKTEAIRNTIQSYAKYYNYTSFNSGFTTSSNASDIMICGFDNMVARKLYFHTWKNHLSTHPEPSKCLFIDGRLNAEEFQVLSIKGDDLEAIEKYEKDWLFDDREVEEAVCSYKQTTFMSNMIASVMANVFVNFVANECEPIYPRDVPFFISYSADTMFTKTIL